MKIFNGRAAAEEYMSTHSLTFSTPEMTLKKFALWLGEQVKRTGEEDQIPRLILYVEEKSTDGAKMVSDFTPDVDDTFKPSGAVTEMYSGISTLTEDTLRAEVTPPGKDTLSIETKYCIECGSRIKIDSKFCTRCGTKQK